MNFAHYFQCCQHCTPLLIVLIGTENRRKWCVAFLTFKSSTRRVSGNFRQWRLKVLNYESFQSPLQSSWRLKNQVTSLRLPMPKTPLLLPLRPCPCLRPYTARQTATIHRDTSAHLLSAHELQARSYRTYCCQTQTDRISVFLGVRCTVRRHSKDLLDHLYSQLQTCPMAQAVVNSAHNACRPPPYGPFPPSCTINIVIQMSPRSNVQPS